MISLIGQQAVHKALEVCWAVTTNRLGTAGVVVQEADLDLDEPGSNLDSVTS